MSTTVPGVCQAAGSGSAVEPTGQADAALTEWVRPRWRTHSQPVVVGCQATASASCTGQRICCTCCDSALKKRLPPAQRTLPAAEDKESALPRSDRVPQGALPPAPSTESAAKLSIPSLNLSESALHLRDHLPNLRDPSANLCDSGLHRTLHGPQGTESSLTRSNPPPHRTMHAAEETLPSTQTTLHPAPRLRFST